MPVIITMVISSCAIQVVPTGGERDTKPPVAKDYSPQNYSVNVTAREIKINFDELIVLKDVSKELIVSPLMDKPPEVTSSKRTVIIKLPDSLQTNTTYTLNFGKAITDLHEGNAYENFQYVFSTGSVLDSLKLSGNLFFANNLKTEEGLLALLYHSQNDSVVFKSKPDYYAITDKSGNFTIKNISPGTYRLFGIKDLNANYKFDKGDEEIGFVAAAVLLPADSNYSIKLFKETDIKPRLVTARKEAQGRVAIGLSAPALQFDFQLLDTKLSKEKLFLFKNTTKDVFTIFYNDTVTDSLNAVIKNGIEIIDTIRIVINSKSKISLGRYQASDFNISHNAADNSIDLGDSLTLAFLTPVKLFDQTKILLYKDSVLQPAVNFSAVDSQKFQYKLNLKLLPQHQYYLIIPQGAITNILDHKNDTVVMAWQTRSEREYGTLAVSFDSKANMIGNIIQVVNNDDIPIFQKQIDSKPAVLFENMLPGKYRIKVISDKNKNGVFDTGKYFLKTQPEDVFYHREEIQIRANWDVEIPWQQ